MTIPDPIRTRARAHPTLALVSPPRRTTNKGRRFPPDPINVEDVAALLAVCTPQTPGRYGELCALRLRALIVILYRTGLRISEALALEESDLSRPDRAIIVRRGKGGKRRAVLMDAWGWAELELWLEQRASVRSGAIICVLRGSSAGISLSATDARRQLRGARARAGIRKRIAPHQFRHGFAVENYHEGVPLLALQRQLGHAHLGVTEIYLRGIDPLQVLEPIGARRPPMMVVPPAR